MLICARFTLCIVFFNANGSRILCCVGIMAEATKSLILELDARLPELLVMDAMGIFYSQY